MDRDSPSCVLSRSSSDSKWGCDGGNRGGPGGGVEICEFRILDVQHLRGGEDEPDQEPGGGAGSIVVVKVEPDPTCDSPSQDFNVRVKVKLEPVDDCSFQGEMPPVEGGCPPDTTSSTSQGTLDGILEKRGPCQTSLPADGYSYELFHEPCLCTRQQMTIAHFILAESF
uniref:uncharacterized protein isoform X3 n=1 Tax=Myxine glutinosa TaxID=7769 RepID=UPI0035900E16